MRIRQVTLTLLFACLGSALAPAQEEEAKAFEFVPLVVERSLFSDQVKMMTKERDEYATNLAIFAGNFVIERKASALSLETARRMLAVALHLSPRNRNALVIGFQLKKGILPEGHKADYSPAVLSRLLLSRGRLLSQEEAEDGKLLARCFVEIAAIIDPRNEDAVFEFEIQRLDHGDVDWEALYDVRKKEDE